MRHNSSGRRSRQQPAASSQQPTGFKKCAGKHHINYTEHEWPTSRVFLSYSQIFFFPKKVCYSFTQFDQNMKTWSEICIFPKQNWSCLSCSLLLLQVTFSSSQSTAKMIIYYRCPEDKLLYSSLEIHSLMLELTIISTPLPTIRQISGRMVNPSSIIQLGDFLMAVWFLILLVYMHAYEMMMYIYSAS